MTLLNDFDLFENRSSLIEESFSIQSFFEISEQNTIDANV